MKKENDQKEIAKKAAWEGKFCFSNGNPAKFLRAGLPFCCNKCARRYARISKMSPDSKKLYTFTTMTQGSNYLTNRAIATVQDNPENLRVTARIVTPGIKSPAQHGTICNTMQGNGRRK